MFEAVKVSGLKYMMFETSCYHEELHSMRQIYNAGGLGKRPGGRQRGSCPRGIGCVEPDQLPEGEAECVDDVRGGAAPDRGRGDRGDGGSGAVRDALDPGRTRHVARSWMGNACPAHRRRPQ